MRRLLAVGGAAVAMVASAFGLAIAFGDDKSNAPDPAESVVSFSYEIDDPAPCGVPPYKPCEWSEELSIGISQEQG